MCCQHAWSALDADCVWLQRSLPECASGWYAVHAQHVPPFEMDTVIFFLDIFLIVSPSIYSNSVYIPTWSPVTFEYICHSPDLSHISLK